MRGNVSRAALTGSIPALWCRSIPARAGSLIPELRTRPTAQEKKTDQPMNYEILAMIIGFTTLAVLMNRNTAAVISELDELQNEMRQRLDETRKDTDNRLDSVRTDVTKSRTEMN